MRTRFLSILFCVSLIFPMASAAHYIVGYVENSSDGTSPDGRTIEVLDQYSDTLNDIVGITGNSRTANIYLVDCERFTVPCEIGDVYNITLVDDGSGYVGGGVVQVTVTGSGYDLATNISLVSPTIFNSTILDDDSTVFPNEIDLNPGGTKKVTCSSIITKYTGDEAIVNGTSEIYYYPDSGPGFGDDNNEHYTNDSCEVDTSYGNSLEVQVNCTFEVEYYANAGTWQCFMKVADNNSIYATSTDNATMNDLLAIEVISPMNFSNLTREGVSNETVAEVINYGNVGINLSLSGYAATEGDGYSMNCDDSIDSNISVEHMKFNLTGPNTGPITRSELNLYYTNLSASPTVNLFGLDSRTNDGVNDARKDTYWRVWIPSGASGYCEGNIIFGATKARV